MSFILSSGNVQTPLNNGGVAYGTGAAVKVSEVGIAGQVLTSTGAGQPAWTTLKNGTQNFTANGAITAGQQVSLTAADIVTATGGSVSSYTVTASSNTWSTNGVLNSAQIAIAFDPTNSIVVVTWADNSSGYSYFRSGVISGTTITWDAGATVLNSSYCYPGNLVTFDQTAAAFLFIFGQANNIIAKAATITTGGTITTGNTPTIFGGGTCFVGDVTYQPASGTNLVTFKDSSYNLSATTISITGTTVNGAGTNTTLYAISGTTSTQQYCHHVYDSYNQKTIIFYIKSGVISYNVITPSAIGTVTNAGNVSTSLVANENIYCATFNSSNNTIAICYANAGQTIAYSAVASLSGTTLTIQTATQSIPTGASILSLNIGYDQNALQFIFIYSKTTGTYNQYYRIGSGTSTSITFGTEQTLFTSNAANGSVLNTPLIYTNSTVKALLAATCFTSDGSTFSDKIQFFKATVTTNYSNWIGISNETVANGATVNVTTLGGINNSQTGLTLNSTYYVDQFGNLSTSSIGNIKVGKATSTTEIYVTGTN